MTDKGRHRTDETPSTGELCEEEESVGRCEVERLDVRGTVTGEEEEAIEEKEDVEKEDISGARGELGMGESGVDWDIGEELEDMEEVIRFADLQLQYLTAYQRWEQKHRARREGGRGKEAE